MSFTEDELAEITTDIAIDNLRKQETITAQPEVTTENTEEVSIEDLKEKESLENDKVEE